MNDILASFPPNFLQNVLMGSVFAFLSISFYRLLRRLNNDDESKLNFEELLLDHKTGKMSRTACGYFFSLAVASWVVVYMSFKGTLSDAMYLCYVGATIGPLIAKIIKGDPDDPQPPAAGPTTTITSDKVTVQQ